MRKTVLGFLLVAATVSMAQDSALVAAAKKTNRKNSKTTVITNETVGRGSSGRVSYASGAPKPLPVVPSTTATAAPAQKQDNTPRPSNQKPAPDPVSGYQTTVRNIEPQSTIRTSTPQAAPARAPQTAPTTMPTSAGRNIDPASSARNVAPTVVQPAQPAPAQPPR